MTEAMPFLRNLILLSYDPRPARTFFPAGPPIRRRIGPPSCHPERPFSVILSAAKDLLPARTRVRAGEDPSSLRSSV